MPKKTVEVPMINRVLLQQISDATNANSFVYVSKIVAAPMLNNNPPLVMQNETMTNAADATQIATRTTEAAAAFLATPEAAVVVADAAPAGPSPYAIIKNVVLPEAKKRFGGRSGAPTVYPFDTMDVGDSFYVPKSEKHKDPLKTLGSTVSSINHKFSVETGETKTKKVAQRGEDKKPIVGVDGKKVMVDTVVKLRKPERKFTIRAVEAGKVYGEWTAPADGVLIARTL